MLSLWKFLISNRKQLSNILESKKGPGERVISPKRQSRETWIIVLSLAEKRWWYLKRNKGLAISGQDILRDPRLTPLPETTKNTHQNIWNNAFPPDTGCEATKNIIPKKQEANEEIPTPPQLTAWSVHSVIQGRKTEAEPGRLHELKVWGDQGRQNSHERELHRARTLEIYRVPLRMQERRDQHLRGNFRRLREKTYKGFRRHISWHSHRLWQVPASISNTGKIILCEILERMFWKVLQEQWGIINPRLSSFPDSLLTNHNRKTQKDQTVS